MARSERKKRTHLNPERVSALGMLRYAIEFFAAADATDEAIGSEPGCEIVAPVPVIFLTARAVELGLKAYLIHCGVDLKRIVDELRHDLLMCLEEAEKHGFSPLENGVRQLLRLLNDSYKFKDLEYFFSGSKTLPEHGALQTVTVRILDEVVSSVPDAQLLLRSKSGQIFSAFHRSSGGD
ncbi:MAG: hypothetical protein AB1749_04930 [Pseudomonadota bacterium]